MTVDDQPIGYTLADPADDVDHGTLPVDSTYRECCGAIGRHADGCLASPLILRRLLFAEGTLLVLADDFLKEAAETPLADAERHGGLHDAAVRLHKAAAEIRFLRSDVAGLVTWADDQDGA